MHAESTMSASFAASAAIKAGTILPCTVSALGRLLNSTPVGSSGDRVRARAFILARRLMSGSLLCSHQLSHWSRSSVPRARLPVATPGRPPPAGETPGGAARRPPPVPGAPPEGRVRLAPPEPPVLVVPPGGTV